jgi:peptidoglycan/LPS O-acetylase OafA/YrhL
MVLIGHGYISIEERFGVRLPFRDILLPGGQVGLLGVQIFFGLSGFLITSRLLAEEDETNFIDRGSFYIRRCFRLMPPALLFVGFLGALTAFNLIHVTAGRLLSSALFFANYTWAEPSSYLAHFWSLAVEEHFYFVWPSLIIWAATGKRRLSVGATLALLIAVWRFVDWKFRFTGDDGGHFIGRTDIIGDGILWGAVIGIMCHDKKWGPRLRGLVQRPLVWGALILLVGYISFGHFGWKTSFALITIKDIAIPLCILGTVAVPNGNTSNILQWTPVAWVGRISYSIYLWQQPFFQEPLHSSPSLQNAQTFPLNITITFLLGTLSYYLFEKPMIKLGHSIAGRKTKTGNQNTEIVTALNSESLYGALLGILHRNRIPLRFERRGLRKRLTRNWEKTGAVDIKARDRDDEH